MTETRRLYYEDVYRKEFEAMVMECRPEGKKGYGILLDQSAFYPEGGGQPCDLGTLNGLPVLDVKETGGELLHYLKEAIPAGSKVEGRIDWERRFDLMQQHSGEHMVSGVIHAAFGYNNVGFHMGSDVITIDFSGILDWEQLRAVEMKVNREIWRDLPVKIWFPSEKELAVIPYRSKKELKGSVRIVEYPGVDLCACCGTHVSRTGEIGIVKMLSVEKFHEGVRVEMISGKRVLDYLNLIQEQNHKISVRLSAKPDYTAQAVQRLWEENNNLKFRLNEMETEQFAEEAAKHQGEGNVLILRSGLDADSVRRLTDLVMKASGGRCAVFSKNTDGSWKYAIGEQNADLRELTKRLNAELNGRGGGKPFFVQGSVYASEEEIRRFFQ